MARGGGAAHAWLLAERGAHATVHQAHRAAARRQGQRAHRGDQVGYHHSDQITADLFEICHVLPALLYTKLYFFQV